MYGFTHVRTGTVNFFKHRALGFILKLFEDGSGAFCIEGRGCVVKFPSPFDELLGESYQPNVKRLCYNHVPWYANAMHELLHVWLCYFSREILSPNHATLMQLDAAPKELCDKEETAVTLMQIYYNIGLFHALLISQHSNEQVRSAIKFQRWITTRLQ